MQQPQPFPPNGEGSKPARRQRFDGCFVIDRAVRVDVASTDLTAMFRDSCHSPRHDPHTTELRERVGAFKEGLIGRKQRKSAMELRVQFVILLWADQPLNVTDPPVRSGGCITRPQPLSKSWNRLSCS